MKITNFKPTIEASPAVARKLFASRDWNNAIYKFAFFNGKLKFRHVDIPFWYDLNDWDYRFGYSMVSDEYVKKFDYRYGYGQVRVNK